MKTKIILGLATLAALALPAMADDGYRYRGDRDRVYVNHVDRDRRFDRDGYRRVDRNDYWRHEARERRERFERERMREYRAHHEGFYR